MATGCLSVAYGFFPRVTAVQDRPTVFAQARTLQSLALILAPGICVGVATCNIAALTCNPACDPTAIAGAFATMTCGCTAGTVISGNPYINQYTMPGIVTAVVSLMLLVGFMCLFRNPPPGLVWFDLIVTAFLATVSHLVTIHSTSLATQATAVQQDPCGHHC